jgi:hypothetical protein
MGVLQWSRLVLPSDNLVDAQIVRRVPVDELTGTRSTTNGR